MHFLANYLKEKTELSISPTKSIDVNDIQWDTNETVKNNISHYLIEFNEDDMDKTFNNLHQTILDGAIEYLSIRGGSLSFSINWCILILVILTLLIVCCYCIKEKIINIPTFY